MNFFFNTYPAAFQCLGGGEIQLVKSKKTLERAYLQAKRCVKQHRKVS